MSSSPKSNPSIKISKCSGPSFKREVMLNDSEMFIESPRAPSQQKQKYATQIPAALAPEEHFRLTLEKLPEIPSFCPLQRTHEKFPGSKLVDVVLNTMECLKILSIQATYYTEKAMVRAETHDHVKLNICFYKYNENNDSADYFIMEIHRLSSASFGFRGITKSIFDFVKGETKSLSCLERNRRGFSVPSDEELLMFNEMKKEEVDTIPEPSFETVGIEALNEVILLLDNDRLDFHEHGIESMVYLTDFHSTVEDVSRMIAEIILYGRDPYQMIQTKIYNLIKNGTMNVNNKKMRRWALKILDNCLYTFYHFNNSHHYDKGSLKDSIWFQNEVCQVLLQYLKKSTTNPHEAYLASKCLNTMMMLCDDVRAQIESVGDFYGILEGAKITGKNYHSLLARETNNLFETLRG